MKQSVLQTTGRSETATANVTQIFICYERARFVSIGTNLAHLMVT